MLLNANNLVCNTNKNRRWWCLFVLILTLLGCGEPFTVQLAREGQLDLAQWSFRSRGMVLLGGQWEYYRNRLLTPEDFRNTPPKTGTLSITRLWRDEPAGRQDNNMQGTATLRLHLTLGTDRALMGIRLTGMTAAYRLWLDGKLLAAQGQVGKTRNTEKASFGRKVVFFQPQEKPVTLTLQLSSHNMLGGTLPGPHLLLGTQIQLLQKAGRERRQADILLGIFLLMTVYHLLLFVFNPRDLSTFYFAAFCLLWMANTGVRYVATWMMPDVEPLISARLIYSLDLFTYYLSIPAITSFFRALFPDEVPARLPAFTLASAALFILCILSAQALGGHPLETRLPQYFHLVSLVCVPWSALCLVRALRNRRSGAGLILTGFTTLALVGLNDIFYDLHVITTGFFMPWGMLLFIVFQAFALARRFSRAFSVAESLSRELKEKNTALARMDRLKDEFLANTSHELRTPLSGIIGISESMLAGSAGNLGSAARHNLEMVAASGRRLAGLIKDILDFTRLRNQDMPLELKAVDARALTEMVLSLIGPLAAEKNLELSNGIPEDLAHVKADEDHFQQILYNLLGNAVKFSDHGRIIVSGREDGRMVAISVKDQGMGISQKDCPTLFEPFKQADASARRSRQGLGLGLAITANLVKLHGGDISVRSAPGRGSTFTFTLPRSDATLESGTAEDCSMDRHPISNMEVMVPPLPSAPTPSTEKTRNGPAPRILVVDDDPVNLQVLVNHLHLEGYGVDLASGGARALEMVRENQPELVLLDIMMPGMTGYEVCEHLRQTHSPSMLPVIMLTAKTRVRDIVQGFACGANDYLAKPFEKDELLARVRTQLKLRQAYQTLEENIRLKKELDLRRQTELDLRQNQHRLAELLDRVEDMVVTVNESREISFCNRTAAHVLGYDSDRLLGKPLDLLFDTDELRAMTKTFPEKKLTGISSPPAFTCGNLEILASNGNRIRVDMTAMILTVDEEGMQALILRRTAQGPLPSHDNGSRGKTLAVIQEINRHQERLKGLETSLNGLFPKLKNLAPQLEQEIRSLDQALDGIQRNLALPSVADRRGLGVMVMQLALDYWYEATDLDRVALARESGIWKVYTDRNGYTRTQTLDKYFSEETLPERPRWKWINQTAVYVLAACTTPSALRNRLEAALEEFRFGE